MKRNSFFSFKEVHAPVKSFFKYISLHHLQNIFIRQVQPFDHEQFHVPNKGSPYDQKSELCVTPRPCPTSRDSYPPEGWEGRTKARGTEALGCYGVFVPLFVLGLMYSVICKMYSEIVLTHNIQYTLIRTKLPSTANIDSASSALRTVDSLIPRFCVGHWPTNMGHASLKERL